MRHKNRLNPLFIFLAGMINLALVMAAGSPVFAAQSPMAQMRDKMMQIRQQHPELMRELMNNPHHMLAMAYRNSIISFAKALKKTAEQSDTVPQDVARTAVDEMKLSVDQMEKEHDEAFGALQEKEKSAIADVTELMHKHLSEVKARIAHLDDLAGSPPVNSGKVLDDVEFILQHCETMMKGMRGVSEMPRYEMMKDRSSQDAELLRLVDRMNGASDEKKVGIMSDIISRLVRERAEMDKRFEEMRSHGMRPMYPENHPGPPNPMMKEQPGNNGMDMNDMEMDDAK